MNSTHDFSGRVALVTGFGAGPGFGTARAFVESGSTVVLCDIDAGAVHSAAGRLTAEGHHVFGVPCDAADEPQDETKMERIITTYGRLDPASNNAGIVGFTAH